MFAAEHSIARADRIERRLDRRLGSLASVPEQGRPVADRARLLSLPDIQLVVRYRIIDDENTVRILQVWHTRENRS